MIRFQRTYSLRGVFFLLSIMASCSVFGQTTKEVDYVQQIQQMHFSDAEKTVIPGGTPDQNTQVVFFYADAGLNIGNLDVDDFDSVEIVVISGFLSAELSNFISKFAKLKHVSVVELAEDVDLESVVSPLSNSMTLQSLEICMVDIAYRDCTFLATFDQLTKLHCDVTLSSKEFREIQKLTKLQYLEIGAVANDARTNPVMLPQLKELNLSSPGSITCFKNTTKIETLKIWSKCSKEDVLNIARFASLKSVDLRVDSIEELQLLGSLKNLETLKIAVDANEK